MSFAKRLWRRLDHFELIVANLCLVSLVVVLTLQVVFRYVLSIGLGWSEEVSRFLLVAFVYVSASLAAQRGTHIRVTIALRLFPGGPRPALLLADALWVAFNAVVIVSGLLLLRQMLAYPVYSTSLFLPLAYIYAIIPVAHALMIARIVTRQWRAWRHGEPVIATTHTAGGK